MQKDYFAAMRKKLGGTVEIQVVKRRVYVEKIDPKVTARKAADLERLIRETPPEVRRRLVEVVVQVEKVREVELIHREVDTVREGLAGIGMGASCPLDAGETPKERRKLFRHLDGDTGGSRRVAPNYITRDNKRVKVANFKSFGQ